MRDNNSVFSDYKKQIKNAIEDLKTPGKRHFQIPNLLTLMRLTAPCFIIPAAVVGNVPLIIGLTAFFSLTDWVDGFVARKWHLTSELGEVLDAVTDKVFASTLLLVASFANPILLCNLGLEGVIAGINTHKKLKDVPVKSSIIGKVKTWFLFSLAGLGIISSSLDIASIINTLMITTTVMQVLTIRSYLSSSIDKRNLIYFNENTFDNCIDAVENESNELQMEKVLEENESLKKLKAMRDYLESEKDFLSLDDGKKDNLVNMQKSKKDDFK